MNAPFDLTPQATDAANRVAGHNVPARALLDGREVP